MTDINKTGRNSNINIKRYLVYLLVFILISFLTLYYIYRMSGAPLSTLVSSKFSGQLIVELLLLLIIYYVLDGLRLFYVLKTLDVKIHYKYIFKLVFINVFISTITPLATGGGVAQVYFLNKKGVAVGKALAATTIRTVLASFMIFLSTPIILLSNKAIFSVFSRVPLFQYLLIITVLYIVFFYVAIFRNRFVRNILYLVLRFLHDKELISHNKYRWAIRYVFKHIKLFGEDLALFASGNIWCVLLSLIFTLLFLLAETTFAYLIMRGMGYQVDYLLVILMQVVIIFFMYFTPTPGATGVAEGGFSLLFARFVAQKDIFPLIFYWRFFTKYIGIIIGMILFSYMLIKGGRDNGE